MKNFAKSANMSKDPKIIKSLNQNGINLRSSQNFTMPMVLTMLPISKAIRLFRELMIWQKIAPPTRNPGSGIIPIKKIAMYPPRFRSGNIVFFANSTNRPYLFIV